MFVKPSLEQVVGHAFRIFSVSKECALDHVFLCSILSSGTPLSHLLTFWLVIFVGINQIFANPDTPCFWNPRPGHLSPSLSEISLCTNTFWRHRFKSLYNFGRKRLVLEFPMSSQDLPSLYNYGPWKSLRAWLHEWLNLFILMWYDHLYGSYVYLFSPALLVHTFYNIFNLTADISQLQFLLERAIVP